VARTKALTITELAAVNRTAALNAERLADFFAKAAIVAGDGQKEARLKARSCSRCFYLDRGRLAGQAFTGWTCQLCREEQSMHPNTAVPRVCGPCADAFGLCAQCGGTQDCHQKSRFARRANRKPLAG
jgi:hypothetical protein